MPLSLSLSLPPPLFVLLLARLRLIGAVCLLLAGSGVTLPVVANDATQLQDPHDVVRHVTTLLSQQLQDAPHSEHAKVVLESTLLPVIDFEFIARTVMGRYRQQATEQQLALFADQFRRHLLSQYAALSFLKEVELTVLPARRPIKSRSRVGVQQLVKTASGQRHTITYTLRRDRHQHWRLVNVVFNGINLGKAFRSQFERSVRQYDGDIDRAIHQWAAPAPAVVATAP